MEKTTGERLTQVEKQVDQIYDLCHMIVVRNKQLKHVLETLIPYMETSARIIKDLTGEDIPEDDAKHIEMAKELVK